MKLAFYAPMKPPDHPVPSGDRTIARALIAALESGGMQIDVASTLRTRDGKGDAQKQHALIEAAESEVARLLSGSNAQAWRAWITYHTYYKAPDLIGPAVSKALGIPYVQIEATRARKRLTGPWARFAAAAEAATDAADLVFYFSDRDAMALRRDAPEGQRLLHLRPFLSIATLPPASTLDGPMVSVGMMRAGDKLASYQIIADTLPLVETSNWRLSIVGDGPARPKVEALMAPFGTQVQFIGQRPPDALAETYANAALMFWPGVNEALGLVYLEAQAAGVPVIAQDRPGMRELLAPGFYPAPNPDLTPLAGQIDAILSDTHQRKTLGAEARDHMQQKHLMGAATRTLMQGLSAVGIHP